MRGVDFHDCKFAPISDERDADRSRAAACTSRPTDERGAIVFRKLQNVSHPSHIIPAPSGFADLRQLSEMKRELQM
jgi:hypothetical protein